MSDSEIRRWIGRANRLAAAQASTGLEEPPAVMTRLAQLDALMRSAPPKLLGAYSRFAEADLSAGAELRLGQLELGQAAWSVVWKDDPLEVLRPAAIETRAVDLLLRRLRPRDIPENPDREWRAKGRGSVFVIPLREHRHGRQGDNQPYERRGLLEHRILPRKLGRYSIRLVAAGALRPGPIAPGARPFRGGAALFKDLVLKTGGTPGKLFTVTECRAPDHADQIDAHISQAHDKSCTGLVWPELTMNLADRKQVQRRLAGRIGGPLAASPALDFVLAGTWHERKGKKVVNRGVVFDGFGRRLASFIKTQAFHTASYGTEDIEEGKDITVLLLEDRLIGFGICKDFCDVHEGNAFPKLDMDFYVAPSMGNVTTMEGHITTARQVRGRYGARSFVVQQSDLDIPQQLGFVVPPSEDLSGLSAVTALQEVGFKDYPAR